MNICLIFPKSPNNKALSPTLAGGENLGLGYLAAMLSGIHKVKIINAETDDLSLEETVNETLSFKPIFIGISPVAVTMNNSLEMCEIFKDKIPNVHICMGGHHVSSVPIEILQKEKYVDSIVVGEGEYTITELVTVLEQGKSLDNIRGLAFRSENGIKLTPPRPFIENLNEIPFPDRPTIEKGSLEHPISQARLVTSRGCSGNCTFCTTPNFYKSTWRARSPQNVVDEIEYLNRRYGISFFWISDDSFIISSHYSQKRAEEFALEILKRNLKISFRILCRADSFKNNNTLIPLLKEAGLKAVFIGIEAGSDQILKKVSKKADVKMNYQIIKLLKFYDLEIQTGFIMFTPYSTLKDLRKNAKFLLSIGELYRFFPLTRILDVFPGTSICESLRKDGLLVSTYNYKSNDFIDFTFLEAKTKILADAVNLAYTKEIDEFDKKILNLKFNILPKFKESHDRIPNKIRNIFIDNFEKELLKLNEINFHYFLEIINLAEKNWAWSNFEDLTSNRNEQTILVFRQMHEITYKLFEQFNLQDVSL